MPLSEVLDSVAKEVDYSTLSFYHPSRDWIITDEVMDPEKMKRVDFD